MPTNRRRRALRLGLIHGALWAIGNSLTTGPLVNYLARDLGAKGLALGLVLATPNLAGIVRLAAPALMHRAGTARRASLTTFLASYLLILGLPAIALAAGAWSRSTAMATMIGLLFVHQVLEYVGTVALWTWWADLAPLGIRGRYFGRRQMVQLCVSIPTLLASGYASDYWRERLSSEPDRLLLAYAVPTGLGALCLLGSVIPLALMPATRRYERTGQSLAWASLVGPFFDRRFFRYLVFRSWFSLANGISQTVQNVIYPREVLGLGIGDMSVMKSVTQFGQLGASQTVGRLSDRFGNRPILVAAQACVSASLIFYLAASGPSIRWLLLGAWVLFAAYVAHNICLPNLVLKLAPVEPSPYIAAHEVLGSLFHSAATVGGGLVFDWLRETSPDAAAEPYRSCFLILAAGLVMRSLAVPLIAAVREPGARTWREILAGWRSRAIVNND